MLSALLSRAKIAAAWGLALAALALVPQSTVHAQGSGSFGPGVGAAVLGAWYDTSATIHAAVPADSGVHNIEINDRRRLHVDMFVKVDSEQMKITALSGDASPVWNPVSPDVMTVDRAQNGTTVAAHNVGAKVNAKVVRVNITVNNLTTPLADCDQDEWPYSGAELYDDMDETQTSAQITQVGLLTVGAGIRIDSEEMHITHLTDNPSPPDVMQVTRAQNGTTAAEHSAPSRVYKKNPSPTPRQQCGLGAYRIDLHYNQSNARYISLANEQFLGSTGRTVYDATGTCFTPDASTPGLVRMECNSTGTPPGMPTIGALGSGVVASALFEPLIIGRPISDLTMGGSFLIDTLGTSLDDVSLASGSLRSMTCPDANGDGVVNILDAQNIAKNLGDSGQNSGATIAALVDSGQTTIEISGLGTLAVNDVISVDFEQMRVNLLDPDPDPPITMEVERHVNYTPARTHQAGTTIYRAFDAQPIGDGVAGYTEPRDANPRVYGSPPDLQVNILDPVPAALVGLVISGGTTCP